MFFDSDNMNLDYSLLNLSGLTNNMLNNNSILSAKEGFLRGNMFKDEYMPYKNLTYINIKPKNEREAKLFNVMQYAFAITDLNLYLDLHPDDKNALNLLNSFIKEENKAKEEFISKYGPLLITEVSNKDFNWVDGPWSWENLGGHMYV